MAGYTGTPETNDLLKQLMDILEKNRAERQSAEQQQARSNASSGFAAGFKGGLGSKKPEEAPAPETKEEPLVRPTAAGGSPAARVGIGQRYIQAQQAQQGNPYGVYLAENEAPAPPPTDAGALEEQKKRFTQRLMMERGQQGGPLGGAGAPPPSNTPTTAGIDPSVVNAVSGAGGPVPPMNPAPAAAQTVPGYGQGADADWLEYAAAKAAAEAARGM